MQNEYFSIILYTVNNKTSLLSAGSPRQTNNLVLFQPMFFEISQPRPRLANFLRVHAKNVDNFPRNSVM